MAKPDAWPSLEIAGTVVRPGKRVDSEIPTGRLASGTMMNLPVMAMHGRQAGPAIWLSAAIHGDELNGIEIIRRVAEQVDPRSLSGTIIAVPIVNVFGFINGSRYLPDRRDLNRSFPGSPRGSLAARIAYFFMKEIVERCQYGIDLHTGSNQRSNLPQIRADLDDEETRRIAAAFGAPVMIHSRLRDGSLRAAAKGRNVHALLFEGGEAHRFTEDVIESGVRGVLGVLDALGMIKNPGPPAPAPVLEARRSRWVRANRGGILHVRCGLGDPVRRGETLGMIVNALGKQGIRLRAPSDGLVIGLSTDPLVHRGDAVIHIATEAPTG